MVEILNFREDGKQMKCSDKKFTGYYSQRAFLSSKQDI